MECFPQRSLYALTFGRAGIPVGVQPSVRAQCQRDFIERLDTAFESDHIDRGLRQQRGYRTEAVARDGGRNGPVPVQRFRASADPRPGARELGRVAAEPDDRFRIAIRPESRVEVQNADALGAIEVRCEYLRQCSTRPADIFAAIEEALRMIPLSA